MNQRSILSNLYLSTLFDICLDFSVRFQRQHKELKTEQFSSVRREKTSRCSISLNQTPIDIEYLANTFVKYTFFLPMNSSVNQYFHFAEINFDVPHRLTMTRKKNSFLILDVNHCERHDINQSI